MRLCGMVVSWVLGLRRRRRRADACREKRGFGHDCEGAAGGGSGRLQQNSGRSWRRC